MSDVSQMIQRYSFLVAGAERAAAEGRNPPPQMLHEMNRLYTRAQSILTPMEAQRAQAAVTTMKAQYHQRFDLEAAQKDARAAGYHADRLSKELTGLSPDQMFAASRGEKFAVKGRAPAVDVTRVNQTIANINKDLGQKMDRKAFEKVSDAYQEKIAHRSQAAGDKYLADKFGRERITHAKAAFDGWKNRGLDIALGLQDRRGGAEPDRMVQPTEDTQLRAQIADAWVTKAKDDPDDRASLIEDDRITEAYLTSEHAHGDIARAFDKLDREGVQQEREAYSSPEYQVEDTENVSAY